ncbi:MULTISPECIES: pyridoxal phosphate-dependent aminotransferase family protein [Flagellimonas]|uniref:Pyridoxal phosphate-dependent aminotransferase family protein n=1 Tax=Flagellimonas hadalis TaxID=2597517 RepID=A0A5N5IY31_9FLAO|nr:pyridoxal phosphate-dependent aminotransferase family protein [Allomuricauda hadalis]KAB5492083.1 pyridoxal phosphate-dependent aminotransferase family protein [Allomuricauda hadalis]
MSHSIARIPDRLVQVEGKTYFYFGGTAYLGLQSYPPFLEIFSKNVEKCGMHYGASRKSNVSLDIYGIAEDYLAKWVGAESCLTLSSGYLAAQLVIQTLLQQGHSLFAAPNAHTALHLVGVNKTESFEDLSDRLQKEINRGGPMPVLLFDTIDFSGKQFPHFHALKKLPLEKIMLVGDDSHGIGVVGKNGVGCYDLLKTLNPAKLMVCCSLGKGLGIQAGAILGNAADMELLRNTSFFGGASPALPAFMGTLLDATDIYAERRSKLMENDAFFRNVLHHPSLFKHMEGHPTYEFEDADLARTLEKNGFITTYFNYPDAYGPIVGRIVLSAYHDKEDIQQLANCLNALQD